MSRLAFHSDGKKMGSGNTYVIEIMPNQNDNIRPKSKKKTKRDRDRQGKWEQ